MIAVTKTFPIEDARTLLSLGVRDLGESRDQEAREKAHQMVSGSDAVRAARWHFVGRLQTNKCRSVASYADTVHTVDRAAVADALAAGVATAERPPLPVFLQISLDGDPDRGGVVAGEVLRLADHVATRPELRLTGVMAVAPLAATPAAAFEQLAGVSDTVRAEHPEALAISAGMSQDFDIAVRFGATHVRVGSALLGRRTPNVG